MFYFIYIGFFVFLYRQNMIIVKKHSAGEALKVYLEENFAT